METQPNIFEVLTAIAFIIAFPTAFIAWFRILRAKNRRDYWKNIALFVFPILAVFGLAHLGGLMPAPDLTNVSQPEVSSVQNLFSKMPTAQAILLGVAAAIWLIGGNILFFIHKRRVGKSWWQFLNPLEPPFKDFSGKEWFVLAVLAALSLVFGVAALSLNPKEETSHNKENALGHQEAPLVLTSVICDVREKCNKHSVLWPRRKESLNPSFFLHF